MTGAAFPRELLEQPTLEAARALLGARLVRDGSTANPSTGRRVARIVEVEAYIHEDDRASHARFGPTDRNRVMWRRAGSAYVYLVYGMYHCLNVVTEPSGQPAAVLIRAVEPIEGVEVMRAERVTAGIRRRRDPTGVGGETRRLLRLRGDRLASGPGLVAAAFGLTTTDTGRDLCDPNAALRLEPPARSDRPVVLRTTPRIGVDYAGEPWATLPWRFVDASSPSVSGGTRHRP